MQPLLPGSWLGLLGGGQLGRMFAMAAQTLGYRVAVLDPDADAPASAVADLQIVADYDDPSGLEQLAGLCAAVTTEFENVPAASLAWLGERLTVSPSSASVAIAQDRGLEKAFIVSCGLPVTPHARIDHITDLDRVAADFWPAILKARRLGYDGKGQARVADPLAAAVAFRELGAVPCVLEKRLALDFEISVVVVRGFDGRTAIYPPARNIHRDGILAVSTVQDPIVPDALASAAQSAAIRLAERLDYVGVMCVEFFVTEGKTLLVNEIAPRPHNSGHYSIDAAVTSQFEQQVRVLTRLPLGSTRLHSATLMLNVLGDSWFRGPSAHSAVQPAPVEPDWALVLAHATAKLHLYGKREARRGRKMGHVTFVADELQHVVEEAQRVASVLGIDPW